MTSLDPTYHPDEARRWREVCDWVKRLHEEPFPPTTLLGHIVATVLGWFGLGLYAEAAHVRARREAELAERYPRFLADRAFDLTQVTPSVASTYAEGLARTVAWRRPLLVVPGRETDPDIAAAALVAAIVRTCRNPSAVLIAGAHLAERLNDATARPAGQAPIPRPIPPPPSTIEAT